MTPPTKRVPVLSATLRETGRIAAWALGLGTLTSALGGLLAQHRAGSVAVQAFVAEWGAGRLGVAWADPEAPPPSSRALARRLGLGAMVGGGAAGATLLVATATHAVTFTRCTPSLSGLAVGVVVALFAAVRDELLLRGLVLRAFRHSLTPSWQLLVCGAVAAAARVGQLADGRMLTPSGAWEGAAVVGVAGLAGVGFGALWQRERGAWSACGAHAAFTFVATTAVTGGLCDARWSATPWGGGGQGFDASLAVLTSLGLLVATAALTWYRHAARTG